LQCASYLDPHRLQCAPYLDPDRLQCASYLDPHPSACLLMQVGVFSGCAGSIWSRTAAVPVQAWARSQGGQGELRPEPPSQVHHHHVDSLQAHDRWKMPAAAAAAAAMDDLHEATVPVDRPWHPQSITGRQTLVQPNSASSPCVREYSPHHVAAHLRKQEPANKKMKQMPRLATSATQKVTREQGLPSACKSDQEYDCTRSLVNPFRSEAVGSGDQDLEAILSSHNQRGRASLQGSMCVHASCSSMQEDIQQDGPGGVNNKEVVVRRSWDPVGISSRVRQSWDPVGASSRVRETVVRCPRSNHGASQQLDEEEIARDSIAVISDPTSSSDSGDDDEGGGQRGCSHSSPTSYDHAQLHVAREARISEGGRGEW
jgi:hypothetical protein